MVSFAELEEGGAGAGVGSGLKDFQRSPGINRPAGTGFHSSFGGAHRVAGVVVDGSSNEYDGVVMRADD